MGMILREAKVVYTSRRVDCGRVIRSPIDAVQILREYGLADEVQECFVVLHLNARNQVQSVQTVARGSLSEVTVHPREVFRAAILHGSMSIIVAHNHPSGDPQPSSDDVALTDRLTEVGKLLGIPVLDHVIVAGEDYHALSEV